MLDVDPKPIHKINFTGNQDRRGKTAMYFTIEEAKETTKDFSDGAIKYSQFILLQYNINIKWLNLTLRM